MPDRPPTPAKSPAPQRARRLSAGRSTGPELKALAMAVANLAERVAALETRAAAPSAPVAAAAANPTPHAEPTARAPLRALPLDERYWLIHALDRRAEPAGGVAFGGRVTLPTGETYYWQIEQSTPALLGAEWTAAAAPLAALAHPVRLALLRALLSGTRDVTSLAALPGLGTTGQLYHHLKHLEAAGWIRQPRRGHYAVLAERVIPLASILAACEVGGEAATAEA